MSCAIPEALNLAATDINKGNMGDDGFPFCEHNIACDIDAASNILGT